MGDVSEHDELSQHPLSINEQWDAVESWHQLLQNDSCDDYPILASFNKAWGALNDIYSFDNGPFMKRGRDCGASDSPLSTLFFYVEMGFYPPPELLLALSDAWHRYRQASGAYGLEDAFFGKSKKGAGNYSKRARSRSRMTWITLEFNELLREGKTRTQCAELISERLGGKPDADSILRGLRGFNGFAAMPTAAEK